MPDYVGKEPDCRSEGRQMAFRRNLTGQLPLFQRDVALKGDKIVEGAARWQFVLCPSDWISVPLQTEHRNVAIHQRGPRGSLSMLIGTGGVRVTRRPFDPLILHLTQQTETVTISRTGGKGVPDIINDDLSPGLKTPQFGRY